MLRHVIAPDGVPIACDVGGVGPPLVLVHGAGSARWGFDALRPRLERAFTVIAIDRRGRGDSGDGAGDYQLVADFEDAAAVVRNAGEDALLFGHSYGALVAAGAATLLPGLPKLALYEPPMGGVLTDSAWIAWFEERLQDGDREEAVRRFLRDVGGYTDAEMDQMRRTRAWARRLAVAPTVPRRAASRAGARPVEPRAGEARASLPDLRRLREPWLGAAVDCGIRRRAAPGDRAHRRGPRPRRDRQRRRARGGRADRVLLLSRRLRAGYGLLAGTCSVEREMRQLACTGSRKYGGSR